MYVMVFSCSSSVWIFKLLSKQNQTFLAIGTNIKLGLLCLKYGIMHMYRGRMRWLRDYTSINFSYMPIYHNFCVKTEVTSNIYVWEGQERNQINIHYICAVAYSWALEKKILIKKPVRRCCLSKLRINFCSSSDLRPNITSKNIFVSRNDLRELFCFKQL